MDYYLNSQLIKIIIVILDVGILWDTWHQINRSYNNQMKTQDNNDEINDAIFILIL